MDEHSFTAGITFADDRVLTVDVTGLDGEGISYTTDEGSAHVPWTDVKAVMLATTDHMLESAGSLFAMADRLQASGEEGAHTAAELRRFAVGILQQAAPRLCPLGTECGLWPGRASQGQPAQD